MGARTTDIVFLFPPGEGSLGVFKNHLGAAYLRASLASLQIRSEQYLNSHPGTMDEVAREVLHLKPAIVGFTVYDQNLPLALTLARRIKQRRRDVRIVFGGPAATLFSKGILDHHPEVDACAIGEAELTAAQLFGALLAGRRLDESIPGIAFRREGTVFCSSVPPLVGGSRASGPHQSVLDSAPSPYLAGILTDGRTGILTGRGCTHHCQYCLFAALGRRKLRLHSIERVLAELEFIARHQRRTGERYPVPVHDDAFTLVPDRAKRLCQAIADRDFGLVLACMTRADTLDEELIRLMREAGFASLVFGLESAVPSVLRAIGKVRPPDWPDPDLTPERDYIRRVKAGIAMARKHAFQVGVSIILGLPGETASDGADTLHFIDTLPVDYYVHNCLWIFPGTPLWTTHDRYGIQCTLNARGLAETTGYAYDVAALRPRARCTMEQDCRLVQQDAADALFSCRSPRIEEGGISAAVVRADHLDRRAAEWLAGILDIGGVLIHVYPPLPDMERSAAIDRDRVQFDEASIPARHYIQMQSQANESGIESWVATCSRVDLYALHQPGVLSVRAADDARFFVHWLAGIPSQPVLCELSAYLHRPKELKRLLKRTDERQVDERLYAMPVPPGVKYAGRWLYGTAPCLTLSRIELDQNGFIRCCSHGRPIGRIGDTKRILAKRLADLAHEAERRRRCHLCSNSHCPRCPFPGISENRYCAIMTRQTRSIEFLNRAYICSRLPSILAAQQDRIGGD